MATLQQTLERATDDYHAGKLAEAEAGYRQALLLDSQNAFALHQLGALAMESGQLTQARDFLAAAVARDSSQVAYQVNLGECFRQLGQLGDAEHAWRNALQKQPDWAQVQTSLGTLLQGQGRFDEAAAWFRRALKHLPDSPDAHFDLGSVRHMQRLPEEAAEQYQAALALDPLHVLAMVNLATIRKQKGELDSAIELFERALALEPTNAVALSNLAGAYDQRGQTDEALARYQEALTAQPNSITARIGLGALLQKLGRHDEAMGYFEAVHAAAPNNLLALHGKASVLYARGRLSDALEQLHQALDLAPSDAQTHLNIAKMLNEQGLRDQALVHGRKAIEYDPRLPSAHGNLAVAMHLLGEIDQALIFHRSEIELNPGSSLHHSNLLYCLNYHPGIDPQTMFAEHRAWAARHADPLTNQAPAFTNDRTPDRRLRIGYVSPHFYAHAVNFFVEPILAAHDHAAVEVTCYSDVAVEDETTARLRGYADRWRAIRGQGHGQVALLIRQDEIDILVDLTGHIGENRMPMFARKPAPVQVTYIGYQNTTGMQAMDYRLTDAYADPPGLTDAFHSEQLVRLPRSFFCYLPTSDAPDVGPLPAIERGSVTFGSFNNFAKITPDVLAVWADILRSVPKSRLLLLADLTDSMEQRIVDRFAAWGIASDRLELVRRQPRPEYLRRISSVDIALDPFPFNGHTTTCDCLWQGVPVITLSGNTYVSRFGGSGLHTLGLAELIATSTDEYRAIAVRLAGDLAHLAELRATLRPRMAASPLLDFTAFTRELEAAYLTMWRVWCAK